MPISSVAKSDLLTMELCSRSEGKRVSFRGSPPTTVPGAGSGLFVPPGQSSGLLSAIHPVLAACLPALWGETRTARHVAHGVTSGEVGTPRCAALPTYSTQCTAAGTGAVGL